MNEIKLGAATRRPRLEVSSFVADEIQICGGMITDVRQFSNLGLLLRFDILAPRLTSLVARLEAGEVSLDTVSRSAAVQLQSSESIEVALHIRFYGEEPDLRIPTPAVPG